MSRALFPCQLAERPESTPNTFVNTYFCINTNLSHVLTRQVHACLCTQRCLVYHHKTAHDSIGCEVWIWHLRYPNKGSFLCSLSGSRAIQLPLQGQQPCGNTWVQISHTLGISHSMSRASMCSIQIAWKSTNIKTLSFGLK